MYLTREVGGITAELEVMIAEEQCRKIGYGMLSAQLMMVYGRRVLKVSKFMVKIGCRNDASMTMFRDRLGFRLESHSHVFQEDTLVKDGGVETIDLELEEYKEDE